MKVRREEKVAEAGDSHKPLRRDELAGVAGEIEGEAFCLSDDSYETRKNGCPKFSDNWHSA